MHDHEPFSLFLTLPEAEFILRPDDVSSTVCTYAH